MNVINNLLILLLILQSISLKHLNINSIKIKPDFIRSIVKKNENQKIYYGSINYGTFAVKCISK
jgi:hypothetical protein